MEESEGNGIKKEVASAITAAENLFMRKYERGEIPEEVIRKHGDRIDDAYKAIKKKHLHGNGPMTTEEAIEKAEDAANSLMATVQERQRRLESSAGRLEAVNMSLKMLRAALYEGGEKYKGHREVSGFIALLFNMVNAMIDQTEEVNSEEVQPKPKEK
jgi:hypothetical protein